MQTFSICFTLLFFLALGALTFRRYRKERRERIRTAQATIEAARRAVEQGQADFHDRVRAKLERERVQSPRIQPLRRPLPPPAPPAPTRRAACQDDTPSYTPMPDYSSPSPDPSPSYTPDTSSTDSGSFSSGGGSDSGGGAGAGGDW